MATVTGAFLKSLAKIAAQEKMRLALNGIHVKPLPNGDGTRFSATDGRRLLRVDVATNGTGTGFITHEHLKAMRASDVISIEGDELTILGPVTVRAKMAREGSEDGDFGKFPNTDDILGEAPVFTGEPVGFNSSLLGELCDAIHGLVEGGTVRVRLGNPKQPMMLDAHGVGREPSYRVARDAAVKLGVDVVTVGPVTIRAAIIPVCLD